jgi:hypothetical protein
MAGNEKEGGEGSREGTQQAKNGIKRIIHRIGGAQ